MQTPVLDALSAVLEKELRYKHNASGTPTTNYVHGPGGIFGVAGLERDVISTRIKPRGLLSALAARGTLVTNPLYPYLTGFLAGTGNPADGPCDDPPVAGPAKSCLQTAQFGRYSFRTKELEVNRMGQRINRGEFVDLQLVNEAMVDDMAGLLSGITGGVGGARAFASEMLMAKLEVGVSFQNALIRQLYVGNPANNTNGGYAEFPGLDILIGTNKVDAITGTECPSLDSDIKDFNCVRVEDFDNGDIVNVVTYMMRYLRHNADRMQLSPVEWAITMRPELFYELTAVWPCSYLTYRCAFRAVDGTQTLNVDAGDAIAMRDAMRNGSYLLIDGLQVPVIMDDGITELTAGDDGRVNEGCFCSDIYFIPLAVRGNYAATFIEYLDYSQGTMPQLADAGMPSPEYWTDGGRFLWTTQRTNWCLLLLSKIEPRLILRTPQLAGRILNVQYCPLQHTRTAFPDDPYFPNGGETGRSGPSLFSDWNLPG